MKQKRYGKIIGGVAAFSVGVVTGIMTFILASQKKDLSDGMSKEKKYKNYYYMLNHWMQLRQEGKSLCRFFEKNGYKEIAIYGMGEMGRRLYDELVKSGITVKYVVDQYAEGLLGIEVKAVGSDADFENVDVMIVTATFAFEEISERLKEKIDFPIISLDEVVYSCC